jgi:kumamolisin
MPAGTDGAGTTLAIIELGGGFVEADLRAYFAGIGVPEPRVRAVGVDGAGNAPEGDPASPDGEVMLDIEVAGGLAPATDIAVYFAPNTDAGFLDAVSEAAHADPTPTAISISWGQSEDQWTAQARTAMDEAFADAGALGVTVTAAAGDDGSADNETDRRAHVDFPAASPGVLGCGGTTLSVEPTSETVWGGSGRGATGGGVSRTFPLPAYQSSAGVPGQAETGRPAAACRTWPRTPTRPPATSSGWTDRRSCSAAPVRSRRCGRPWSAGSSRPSAVPSAGRTRRCTTRPGQGSPRPASGT